MRVKYSAGSLVLALSSIKSEQDEVIDIFKPSEQFLKDLEWAIKMARERR